MDRECFSCIYEMRPNRNVLTDVMPLSAYDLLRITAIVFFPSIVLFSLKLGI